MQEQANNIVQVEKKNPNVTFLVTLRKRAPKKPKSPQNPEREAEWFPS